MPDSTFRVKLITPTERMLDAEVTSAGVPMHDGQLGLLPGRAPIVGELGPGPLTVDIASGGERVFYIEGGFMQNVGGDVTVLATGAQDAAQMDLAEEKAALAEVKARTSSDAEEMDRITEQRHRASIRVAIASAKR